MSKETNIKCEYCGGCGYHKMSCTTHKVTLFLSDVKVEGVTAESDGVSGKHEGATKSGVSEIPTYQSCGIPTLEGAEAEEFIRKAESAERGTVDWSRQMKQMERILEKSRIANRKLKYTKGETLKVKRSKDVEE